MCLEMKHTCRELENIFALLPNSMLQTGQAIMKKDRGTEEQRKAGLKKKSWRKKRRKEKTRKKLKSQLFFAQQTPHPQNRHPRDGSQQPWSRREIEKEKSLKRTCDGAKRTHGHTLAQVCTELQHHTERKTTETEGDSAPPWWHSCVLEYDAGYLILTPKSFSDTSKCFRD